MANRTHSEHQAKAKRELKKKRFRIMAKVMFAPHDWFLTPFVSTERCVER